jgi:hypothetical protein
MGSLLGVMICLNGGGAAGECQEQKFHLRKYPRHTVAAWAAIPTVVFWWCSGGALVVL